MPKPLKVLQNGCGTCNACCVQITIPELDKPAGIACPSLKHGRCSIYKTRPSVCREFECFWLQDQRKPKPVFDVSYRPDRLGLIMTFQSTGLGETLLVYETRDDAAYGEQFLQLVEVLGSTGVVDAIITIPFADPNKRRLRRLR